MDCGNYSVLLSEDVSLRPHEMKINREKIAEFFFEKLNVPNIYFLKNPVLSCFATGTFILSCRKIDSSGLRLRRHVYKSGGGARWLLSV